jgi:5'-3' exonuclease
MKMKQMVDDRILFVDLSYLIFYKFYALLCWCKISDGDTTNESLMLEKFARNLEVGIYTLIRRYQVKWENVYLALDTPRDMIWRNAYFKDYKKNRGDQADQGPSAFNPKVFTIAYETVLPAMQKKYGFHVLRVATAEADDIVAVCHSYTRKHNPMLDIYVITNDNDYVQLLDEKTFIYNAQGKELKTRFTPEVLSVFILWKVIKGDKSDNIPSIGRLIGDKTAFKLATDPAALEAKMDANENMRRNFEMNKLLMDFRCIPSDLVARIENLFLKN